MDPLEEFTRQAEQKAPQTVEAVRDYANWALRTERASFPSEHDDVAIRTYLMHLRANGAGHEQIEQSITALKQFYAWAVNAKLIASSPFEAFSFDRPVLSHEQIRRRQEMLPGDAPTRELARLRGLVRVAERLNRSVDVQTLVEDTLETLLQVMQLQAAWAFILTGSGIQVMRAGQTPPHDFALAGACGLPPGLEQEDRRFLTEGPDCHCQQFFRGGHLHRAVNIVECTRLQRAAAARGDNTGLLFHASVPLIVRDRRIGLINVATSEWQLLTSADLQFLSSVGAQVGIALERAHLYDVAEDQRARFQRELGVAHQVQSSLLPRGMPEVTGFRFAADWRSAREVAGDFYDIFPLPEGRWGIVIGDVADKGAPAALYMAMARSLIRSAAPRHHGPANALIQVNERITSESSYDTFITLFYAMLDPANRTLKYANAGHNPPILRRNSGELEELPRTGHFLGAFSPLHLLDAEVTLAPGDALVAYTDGVTDAQSPSGQDYGVERLRAAVQSGPAGAPDLLEALRSDLAGFTQGTSQPDDITLLLMTGDESSRQS
ncbi:MAG: SpoIIE family protein phosphatase [Rudaea sp.]